MTNGTQFETKSIRSEGDVLKLEIDPKSHFIGFVKKN